jgi:hypothetical protein
MNTRYNEYVEVHSQEFLERGWVVVRYRPFQCQLDSLIDSSIYLENTEIQALYPSLNQSTRNDLLIANYYPLTGIKVIRAWIDNDSNSIVLLWNHAPKDNFLSVSYTYSDEIKKIQFNWLKDGF